MNMNVLFLHNNYPAQFLHVAAALAQNPHNRIVFLAQHNRRPELQLNNVRFVRVPSVTPPDTKDEAEKVAVVNLRTGQAYANAMLELAKTGFVPHVVHDHPGWGGSLFVSDIFPEAARVSFFEWFYSRGADYAFMARGKARPAKQFSANRMRNHVQLDALRECNFGIVPTMWQFAQYPVEFSSKLRIVHDGVDTAFFSPLESSPRVIGDVDFSAVPEIVTYATRGLEPYRGFPQFYRSLEAILAERPDCHIVIMGDDKTHYSKPRSDGKTWGQAMREECPLDRNRVHFMNFSNYETYRNLLRISSVHVYLTIPFVLSWSLLEAMSCQCLIVASGTEPVREFVRHEENGLLTPFWDHEALAGAVVDALRQQKEYEPLRKAARQTVLERCDLMKVLPQHLDVLEMAAFHKACLIQQYVQRGNEAAEKRGKAPVEEPAG